MQICKFSNRQIFAIVALLCTIALGYALYTSDVLNITACPLCIMQRVCVGCILLLALIYLLHNPIAKFTARIYAWLMMLLVCCGSYFAIKHEYLLHLPPDRRPISCSAPLSILYQELPFHDFIMHLFTGGASCGISTWTILGLNPPVMVLILLAIILVLALKVICN